MKAFSCQLQFQFCAICRNFVLILRHTHLSLSAPLSISRLISHLQISFEDTFHKMDAPGSSSNRKRRSENGNSRPSKFNRRQLASSEPTGTTITDLNDDCLLVIFEHLSLQGLFNVGVACNWLIPAASAVYKRKFGKKRVCINYDEDTRSEFVRGPHCDFIGNQIKVQGFAECLQYLRCFGESISHLSVWCRRWSNARCHQTFGYVNKYGAENLIQLEFYGKPSISIGRFDKPFVNVRKISIFENDLNDQFPSFPQCFPNVRTLELNNVRASKRYVDTAFQHLTELRIDINGEDFHRFKENEVADLLAMCGQLQNLYIRVYDLQGMTLNSLLNLIKTNKMLHRLTVAMTQYSMTVMEFEIMRLIREHSALVELNLPTYEFTVDNAIGVIGRIEPLRKFNFKIDTQEEYDHLATLLLNEVQQFSCHHSKDLIVKVVKH